MCIDSMERIRWQRQKSKNDGTTMIISNYQHNVSYWGLLSFLLNSSLFYKKVVWHAGIFAISLADLILCRERFFCLPCSK